MSISTDIDFGSLSTEVLRSVAKCRELIEHETVERDGVSVIQKTYYQRYLLACEDAADVMAEDGYDLNEHRWLVDDGNRHTSMQITMLLWQRESLEA